MSQVPVRPQEVPLGGFRGGHPHLQGAQSQPLSQHLTLQEKAGGRLDIKGNTFEVNSEKIYKKQYVYINIELKCK